MTGQILIADALATNRIVLKARLSAAFYTVLTAGGGAETLAAIRRTRPDLVLLGDNLADMSAVSLIAAIAAEGAIGTEAPPVVMLLSGENGAERMRALNAGAADVISRPVADGILLARLRSILRQRHVDADLGVPAATADALGFAEEPAAFGRRRRLAVLAGSTTRAEALRTRIAPALDCVSDLSQGIDIAAMAHDGAGTGAALRLGADAILLEIGEDGGGGALGLLAELQASPQTRHARIVALLGETAAHLAVPMLDMGVHEALVATIDERELALRLSLQIARKARADTLRRGLESGLQAAVLDPLTGLYNRRYALSYLRRTIATAAQTGRACAVMVADLDHFKAVNDRFGHAAGDRVLTQVSARMQAELPAGAMIARIGGEEFMIAVPDTLAQAVRGLAGRLCRAVREMPVRVPGTRQPVRVTVSIGATLAAPVAGAALPEAETLLAEADRALYTSKSGGRDTVTFCRRSAA